MKEYIDVLGKHGIPIQKALLFGSWSRGCAGEESDVDVALISDVFTGGDVAALSVNSYPAPDNR